MKPLYVKTVLRRKYRGWKLLIIMSVFVIGSLIVLFPVINIDSFREQNFETIFRSRHLLEDNATEGFDFPPDVFSLEDRRNGAVVLHVIGLIYMFVALAIVCDEFFVPSLSVLIEKLEISEDVAGATFMAAGGSAPELFTSLIGVFFSRNNVGIGTIVGSAVFNILFVIGMCALFSKTVLELTWWPLFRDVTFYSIDLLVLILVFRDGEIIWWEALILFMLYIAYVLFMKFNTSIETFVKTKVLRRKQNTQVHNDDVLIDEFWCWCRDNEWKGKIVRFHNKCCTNMYHEKAHRSCSIPILHSGTSHFRHGVLQLMIHTIDPISEGQVQDKAMQLHAVASLSQINGTGSNDSLIHSHNGTDRTPQNGSVSDRNKNQKRMQVQAISNGHTGFDNSKSPDSGTQMLSPAKSSSSPLEDEGIKMQSSSTRNSNNTETTIMSPDNHHKDPENSNNNTEGDEMPDDGDEPLDMSWPKTWRKRITYILLAPLIFPMWILLPDTRRPEKKKWYLVSFFGCIVFIFIYSYLMVWWANQTGETIGIPDEIMGLTILAAGTSIPDLITSVIVAKKGFGDMAVSSSVGSNIFDITVGLPIPWLLYAAVYVGKTVDVNSNGLACSILLLFGMLLIVVIVIAASKWRMTKIMGGAMLVLYAVFLVFSVLLELDIINCVL
ncbi:sodium/potassium/calcium exchanger 2-like isoform X1 [Mya arenaria]|uniref:sodium/potassium/calcium exchanger 2-like isoform X1 n=1 Tax=Mya arenaria TaxID=6604 RepID=UPI0022E6941D|nr:sodium/potassium/calcium exchanger 2-like isoform X1 [Mya arenaria]XP_052791366.1 sodium/potassium/calcium exchanger 2-like isoform X1 [Mya arenaria]XP_052791367.1 sodium/potassium/calcium exchanger 2-like isoform X1 [Mya arenaria]XP_052791368.1 sodium/potassium/calcium exchanger 2-like isoform X1 [Mya arenaria]